MSGQNCFSSSDDENWLPGCRAPTRARCSVAVWPRVRLPTGVAARTRALSAAACLMRAALLRPRPHPASVGRLDAMPPNGPPLLPFHPPELSALIFQMGRARLPAWDTTLKSTTLARPEARSIVLSAGPAWWPLSAWAATPARRVGPRHGPIFSGPIGSPIIMSLLI
jgi:hypothetical protein